MRILDIISYFRNHSSVYCYGAGRYGRIIRAYLGEQGMELAGFIVSSENTDCHTQEVLGLPVSSARKILSSSKFNSKENGEIGIIIGVGCLFQDEVTDQIKEYGINDYFCIDDELLEEIELHCRYTKQYQGPNNITVFIYHRVIDIPLDTWKLAVNPELFEQEIRYIKNNYVLMRSEEDWSRAGNRQVAVITFDDGYEDIYTYAFPILKRNGIPATVFVSSGNIDTDNEFWWDDLERIICYAKTSQSSFELFDGVYNISNQSERHDTCFRLHPIFKRMDYKERREVLSDLETRLESNVKRNYCRSMTSSQLKELSSSELITIGGHTVTHSCLAYETTKQQEWEIRDSKRTIEEIIGKKLEVFSYPFGQPTDYSDNTINICLKAGYKRVFAAFEGLTSTAFSNGNIPRINIGHETEYADSIRKINQFSTLYRNGYV